MQSSDGNDDIPIPWKKSKIPRKFTADVRRTDKTPPSGPLRDDVSPLVFCCEIVLSTGSG